MYCVYRKTRRRLKKRIFKIKLQDDEWISSHAHIDTAAAAWNRGFFFILLISFLNEKVTANQEIFMMKYNITNKQIRHGPAARPTLVSRVSTYPYIYIVYSTLRYYELWKFNIYL